MRNLWGQEGFNNQMGRRNIYPGQRNITGMNKTDWEWVLISILFCTLHHLGYCSQFHSSLWEIYQHQKSNHSVLMLKGNNNRSTWFRWASDWQSCLKGNQTHELIYMIGHVNPSSHLWKLATWRFICRGLTVTFKIYWLICTPVIDSCWCVAEANTIL